MGNNFCGCNNIIGAKNETDAVNKFNNFRNIV